MATTPRYIGATVDDAVAYVRASIESDVWFQVFDSDRDGTIGSGSTDETEFVRAVCRAETKVDEILGAAYGAPWTESEFATLPAGTRDAVRECALEMLPWERVKFRPSMSDERKAPYRVLWKDAQARLTKLATDDNARLPDLGPPAPTMDAGEAVVDTASTALEYTNLCAGVIKGF